MPRAERQAAPAAVCLPVDYAYAEDHDGGVLGQILADGRVVDTHGGCVGFVQPDGSVRSAEGVRVGSARRGVAVRGADGGLAAVVSEQGYVKVAAGRGAAAVGPFDGELSEDGVLRSADGMVVGVAVSRAPVPQAVVRYAAGDGLCCLAVLLWPASLRVPGLCWLVECAIHCHTRNVPPCVPQRSPSTFSDTRQRPLVSPRL